VPNWKESYHAYSTGQWKQTLNPQSPVTPSLFERDKWINLNAEVSTINVVSQEEIASVGRMAANLKQLHQVIKLTVHVSTNCHQTQSLPPPLHYNNHIPGEKPGSASCTTHLLSSCSATETFRTFRTGKTFLQAECPSSRIVSYPSGRSPAYSGPYAEAFL